MSHLHQRWERGQGLVEYALIILFVAIAVVAMLGIFGTEVNGMYESLLTHL